MSNTEILTCKVDLRYFFYLFYSSKRVDLRYFFYLFYYWKRDRNVENRNSSSLYSIVWNIHARFSSNFQFGNFCIFHAHFFHLLAFSKVQISHFLLFQKWQKINLCTRKKCWKLLQKMLSHTYAFNFQIYEY